ncbi:Transcription factor WER [Vitis vinifera]|uniref:Transcription factor WER n=1 Tax=Vitis vinifera TaxID=29760 RepID=A0A438BQI4_VITVI|nr:Transcription factor WER [Vitis vinifera]
MGLRWFLSSSMFDGKLIGLISSIFAGKSMMARPKEQRQIWTEEEDHKLIECKSRHPHLSWPNIAMLAGLERSGRSCRERWNNSLTEDNTITRLQLLYGNRANRWNNHVKKKLGISTHQNIPDPQALSSEPEYSKRKLHSYTHFSLTRYRQPLVHF